MNSHRQIVLTGATRGLGLAMTKGFIAAGHTVLGCGRNEEQIETLSATHEKPHDFQCVDISDWNSVHQWADRLNAEYGAPDLLINNAAIMARPAPLWDITAEEFANLMDINVDGTVNTIRAFVPAMIEAGRGIIVNFSSGWGRSTSPTVAPYCASKWAVEGLTQSLAQELPTGLAAIALDPGIINTDMVKQLIDPEADTYPTADQWAQKAVPFILNLKPQQNGKPVSI